MEKASVFGERVYLLRKKAGLNQKQLGETDRFLTNNRRKVLEGKGRISHEAAVKKVGTIYEEFRKKQDAEYISEFDRQIAAYLKGDKL